MRKEIEIAGCVEIPPEMDMDTFAHEFLSFIETKGWCFGGGFREIVDDYYILPNGKKGTPVSGDDE